MANILITHFSGIIFNGEYQSSCFYDGLIKGLTEAGHHCLQILTSEFLARPWNGCNTPSNTYLKHQLFEAIKQFKPDLVISFNNSSIEGIEELIDCPIALWDADSLQFFNDKEKLRKNADRYHYMAFSQFGVEDYITQLKVPASRVCRVPSATAVESRDEEKRYNISFIGNPFFNSPNLTSLFIKHPYLIDVDNMTLDAEKEKLEKILAHFGISISAYRHHHSGERRAKLISLLLDQGMHVFGPNEWLKLAPFESKIIQSYNPSQVFSLKHNQLVYNRSKISLNISHTQNITGYPWRVLDILASSAVLLSDDKRDLQRDFSHLVNLQCYHSASEAYDLSKKILKDNQMREDLILQQNSAIETNYRWKHRLPLIQQLTGVSLENPPLAQQGRYELFRFRLNKKEKFVYKTAIYILKPREIKLSKRPALKFYLRTSIQKMMRHIIPKSIRYALLKAKLHYIQTSHEYQ